MKIAIVGSRCGMPYDNFCDTLYNLFSLVKSEDTIISGGAVGIDTLASEFAKENLLTLWVYPAEWDKFGKQAGFKRNTAIVEACDYLIAFWDGKSTGTRDSIIKALDTGKLFKVVYI